MSTSYRKADTFFFFIILERKWGISLGCFCLKQRGREKMEGNILIVMALVFFLFKKYKGQEVESTHDRQRPEEKPHIKEEE